MSDIMKYHLSVSAFGAMGIVYAIAVGVISFFPLFTSMEIQFTIVGQIVFATLSLGCGLMIKYLAENA